MSGRKPKVFLTQSVPMDLASVQELQQQCDLTIYDEKETGEMVIPRERLLKEVRGIDALFLALPVNTDAELLDAAGSVVDIVIWLCSLISFNFIDLRFWVGSGSDYLCNSVGGISVLILMVYDIISSAVRCTDVRYILI